MAKKEINVTKRYVSTSIPSVVFKIEGRRYHIQFDNLPYGGSVYQTSDPNEQYGLEHHGFYGKLYHMEIVENVEEVEEQPNTATEIVEVEKVNVAGIAEAKEYLVEHFDYTRTALRTKTAILAAAKEHNIEFVGI